MTYLLDTNVISELRKDRPDRGVAAWFERADPDGLYLSVLVIGEIVAGVERIRRRDRHAVAAFDAWLSELRSGFADRIVDVDAATAEEWGRLTVPDPLPTVDGLLAATARVRDWTLVTRNGRDVERTGVRLLDPFQGS